MRTLFICALATTLVGCSSQQSAQPSCVGLNPLACLTAVHVPIEPASYENDSVTAKPVSTVAWRDDSPPRSHACHDVRRTPKPIRVAAKAAATVPIPVPSPQANQQTTGNAVASEAARASEATRASEAPRTSEAPRASQATRSITANPQTTTDVPRTRTTEEQVAAAAAVAEGLTVPTLDASRVRTAMAAAGALEVQLSKAQTTAINRLVSKEVAAAIVGLVSARAADSFPELARFRTFQVPLAARSPNKQP